MRQGALAGKRTLARIARADQNNKRQVGVEIFIFISTATASEPIRPQGVFPYFRLDFGGGMIDAKCRPVTEATRAGGENGGDFAEAFDGRKGNGVALRHHAWSPGKPTRDGSSVGEKQSLYPLPTRWESEVMNRGARGTGATIPEVCVKGRILSLYAERVDVLTTFPNSRAQPGARLA